TACRSRGSRAQRQPRPRAPGRRSGARDSRCRLVPGSRVPPHILRYADDELQLAPLRVPGDVVPLGVGAEAALGGKSETLERDEGARLVDALLQLVLGLHLRALRGEKPEDDDLVVPRVAQGLEAAGALVVVLEQQPLGGDVREDRGGEIVVRLRTR